MKYMENLMVVVKEANKDVAELKKKWKNDGDVAEHYKPFYERVKNQCKSFPFFVNICVQTFRLNLIDGMIIDDDDAIINIDTLINRSK